MTFPVVYTKEPTKPSGGTRPGTKALYDFCLGTFDLVDHLDDITGLGTYNPRDVCGNPWPWKCTGSQHASGRAGDNGVKVIRPKGHPEGHRLAEWLVEHYAELGVQEVIWAGRRWTNQTLTWKSYSGRSDHFDHVHWALNQYGADGLTLAHIEAIWADNDDQEDDDMIPELIKGDVKIEWWKFDGMELLYVPTPGHAAHQASMGLLRTQTDANGDVAPRVVPQVFVDEILATTTHQIDPTAVADAVSQRVVADVIAALPAGSDVTASTLADELARRLAT